MLFIHPLYLPPCFQPSLQNLDTFKVIFISTIVSFEVAFQSLDIKIGGFEVAYRTFNLKSHFVVSIRKFLHRCQIYRSVLSKPHILEIPRRVVHRFMNNFHLPLPTYVNNCDLAWSTCNLPQSSILHSQPQPRRWI